MTIVEAMRDPALFGRWFQDKSWNAWRVFLASLFGLPLDHDGLDLYRLCTGRQTPPTAPAREGWVIAGRRGGKSRIAALIAVFAACFRDYTPHLAPGEIATIPVIAADRRQARTIMRYVGGFLADTPMLSRMVERKTHDTVTFNNRTTVEIHTATFRAIRGYTVAAGICDETAFWRSEESANPDREILAGLRPGLATLPGSLLLCISSPYARTGALWTAYDKHFGRDGDPVFVWRAPTRVMNPTVPQHIVDDALAEDESAARAEYLAEFRSDVETFVSREAVRACTVPDRIELPPSREIRYHAFVDPSGGGQDSFTLAIAHHQGDVAVLDCLREVRPPFSPDDVTVEYSELLRTYGVGSVSGDRYAGEWPRERFRRHGISYQVADRPKSDLYRDLLPLLNSGRVELLDNHRLASQLCGLERRTARSGRDSIDHPPRQHDDVCNVAAGVLCQVGGPRHKVVLKDVYGT